MTKCSPAMFDNFYIIKIQLLSENTVFIFGSKIMTVFLGESKTEINNLDAGFEASGAPWIMAHG